MQWGCGVVEIVMEDRAGIVMGGLVFRLGEVRWVGVRWVDRSSQLGVLLVCDLPEQVLC